MRNETEKETRLKPAENTLKPAENPGFFKKNLAGEKKNEISAPTISAFLMLVSGILLVVASFVIPPTGEISDSAMAFMGEALIYAGSVFGLKLYVDKRTSKM